jgi:hypothetical protein
MDQRRVAVAGMVGVAVGNVLLAAGNALEGGPSLAVAGQLGTALAVAALAVLWHRGDAGRDLHGGVSAALAVAGVAVSLGGVAVLAAALVG